MPTRQMNIGHIENLDIAMQADLVQTAQFTQGHEALVHWSLLLRPGRIAGVIPRRGTRVVSGGRIHRASRNKTAQHRRRSKRSRCKVRSTCFFLLSTETCANISRPLADLGATAERWVRIGRELRRGWSTRTLRGCAVATMQAKGQLWLALPYLAWAVDPQ